MATNVQRSGLSFERFFRRGSSSPGRNGKTEESPMNADEDGDASKEANESGLSKFGKFFGQKSADGKDESPDDPRRAPAKKTDEVATERTEGSKKSTKKNKPAASAKQEEKREDTEACKELVIKDDVGQVKLTEIINNSIKEAVLNIVKEGVCPLADSLERAKDQDKKTPFSVSHEAQDKENKPESPKQLASLVSGANKTFDSHLCRSQYQPSSSSHGPYKTTGHVPVTVNQCTRESCPRASDDRKFKSSKQRDKSLREASPRTSREAKGSSHFRTDNRRMTGNVNIYICSEANETAKDKKQKDKSQCNDDSETTSETKTCTSSLSASTSKLVAALRKKQRKNQEDQPPSCLCDIPESSAKQYRSAGKIGEDGEDVSCLCDDGSGVADFLDTRSSSSGDADREDEKFSDLDFAARSDLGSDRACTSQDCGPLSESASDRYGSYDKNDFWPCATEDRPGYEEACGGKMFEQGQSAAEKDLEERCSCCNLKRCRKDRPSDVPCRQEPRDRIGRTHFNRCPCIVEEEDENFCTDRKEPKETFTVCGNAIPKEESCCSNREPKIEPEKIDSGPGSGVSKGEEQPGSPKSDRTLQIASTSGDKIIDDKDGSKVGDADAKPARPESPKKGLFSTFKKNWKRSADRESKTSKVEEVKDSGEERVPETAEASKQENESASPVADDKRNGSLFYRSMKRAVGMVSTRKNGEAAATEENENSEPSMPEPLTKAKSNGKNEASGGKGAVGPSSSVTEKGKTTSCITSSPEKRSRSRISTAIASRRSSALTTNHSSNLGLPQGQIQPQTCCSPKNSAARQASKDCGCQKLFENGERRCERSEPPKDESCKCCCANCKKHLSGRGVCCKTIETPQTKPTLWCPACGNPAECCICRKRKPEPIAEDCCRCCPRCGRPTAECGCRCVDREEAEEEFCDRCRRSKRLCCCGQDSRGKRSQTKKCRRLSDFGDEHRQCGVCCSPKGECGCDRRCPDREERCPKSMICIYCDNPQEDCTCRAPVRKCSQCGLPIDVCNCKPPECCDCSGRAIVPAEVGDDQNICVTAWKPRRSVRRYFAREADDGSFEEDCVCYDKSKPYGSDELPYQKRGVFSTVMSELQQKISGSVCCNVCGTVPCCCCCAKNERGPEVEAERRPRLGTVAERVPCPSQERSRSKSPTESCRCTPTSRRKRGRKVAPKICDRCRTSPCRCRRRSSTSPQKKPQAKCYYCKNSPCM